MQRLYQSLIYEHFIKNRQMLFLAGPRQVGKTTISKTAEALTKHFYYWNWDIVEDRNFILEGPRTIGNKIGLEHMQSTNLPIVVFDEIHKYTKWKNFLKGFYDLYQTKINIIVTGSSRLDVFKSGGDSLMGRYIPYRIHPISVAEYTRTILTNKEILPPTYVELEVIHNLLKFGGFPDPFLKKDEKFLIQWRRLIQQQLFREDIRDLSHIQEIGQLEILSNLLKYQASQLLNLSNLAKKMNVAVTTIKRWLGTLEIFYYCFLIKPYTKNITRGLLREPKLYLWDWSTIKNEGARFENLIASHLLKAVHFWTDRGFGDYELYFIRDKEKREVDFLVTKNDTPWFLVEAKYSSNNSISEHLYRFQQQLKAPHAFQIVLNAEYVDADCFVEKNPVIVPASTFLSQLI